MCGAFDVPARKLRLARAGHLPLIHYSAQERRCRQIVPKGIGVGLENGPLFKNELEEIELRFGQNDVFLFCTDGLTEARDAQGNELETAWLEKAVQENGYTSAAVLQKNIMAKLQQLTTADFPKDDMTLIVVKASNV
jgi:serine phosphatase RsbU (regulator of sigma subunit)